MNTYLKTETAQNILDKGNVSLIWLLKHHLINVEQAEDMIDLQGYSNRKISKIDEAIKDFKYVELETIT